MERIVCILIFAFAQLVAQNEFIFWAQLGNRDFILFHQNENISPAMTSTTLAFEEYACHIAYTGDDLLYLQRTTLGSMDDKMPRELQLKFLNSHKDELMACFFGTQTKVKDVLQSHRFQGQSTTFITMLPTRFRVEFHNDKAVIYKLVKNKI